MEDDIVAKPNYFATMKNFALQLSSEDWMILEFSQLGFIGTHTHARTHAHAHAHTHTHTHTHTSLVQTHIHTSLVHTLEYF